MKGAKLSLDKEESKKPLEKSAEEEGSHSGGVRLTGDMESAYRRTLEGDFWKEELNDQLSKPNKYFEEYPSAQEEGPRSKTTVGEFNKNQKSEEQASQKQKPLKSTSRTQQSQKQKRQKQSPPKPKSQESQTPEDETPKQEILYTNTYRQSGERVTTEDNLNRQKLVDTLAAFLADPSNRHHQTIGLLGDWGVGKSSVVHLLKQALLDRHADQPFLFADFNAWAYEHTDNLQAGIAQEMIKALSSPRPSLEDIKAAGSSKPSSWWAQRGVELKSLWRSMLWIPSRGLLTLKFACRLYGWKLLALLLLILLPLLPFMPLTDQVMGKALPNMMTNYPTMVDVAKLAWVGGFLLPLFRQFKSLLSKPLAKELHTYLKLPDYGKHLGTIPEMRQTVETLCRVRLREFGFKERRLLFVVDDLDRCGHEGIVKVFEAVRLVLEIENVNVIIAVDQRIALAALALHYEDLAKHHQLQSPQAIARDYLAKVIHLPITLSEPDQSSVQGYLEHLWSQLTREEDRRYLEIMAQDSLTFRQGDKHSLGNEGEFPGEEGGLATVHGAEKEPDSSLNPQQPKGSQKDFGGGETKGEDSALQRNKDNNQPVQVTGAKPLLTIASLSEQQKTAFSYWLSYFGLANPRQIKRLNNCYNLLLNYYDNDKSLGTKMLESSKAAELKTNSVVEIYPMMVCLFALEYINSLDNPRQRRELKEQILDRVYQDKEDARSEIDGKITEEILGIVRRQLPQRDLHLVKAVEPFVLPAIEECT